MTDSDSLVECLEPSELKLAAFILEGAACVALIFRNHLDPGETAETALTRLAHHLQHQAEQALYGAHGDRVD